MYISDNQILLHNLYQNWSSERERERLLREAGENDPFQKPDSFMSQILTTTNQKINTIWRQQVKTKQTIYKILLNLKVVKIVVGFC